MTYSSAVFARRTSRWPTRSATSTGSSPSGAGLQRGEHVLEIGIGLGRVRAVRRRRAGLPRHVDHDLARSSTRSRRERVRAAGLADLVDIQLRDYRDIEGTYDAIVSIEMLEAVGAEYFATFFEACDRGARARAVG